MMTETTTYKIDPYNITDYDRSEKDKELFLLFCIVVAGKTAYIQADKLSQFLISIHVRLMMPENISPFQLIKSADQHGILFEEIKKAKLGQYKKINSAFKHISTKEYNLSRMTPQILEEIPGVGMKTSRFFLLHSDPFYKDKIAILDTHILKFIKENMDDRAPKSTPVVPLTYRYWESMFLDWCRVNNKNVAEFDLETWKSYARTQK